MATHIDRHGGAIEHAPSPAVREFLQALQATVDDASASVGDLVELLYSADNPLLDPPGPAPGRGVVTRRALADPSYLVMLDLLDRKRVQRGALDRAAARAAASVSVSEAASRLGVSTSAVRQAIARGTLAAVKQGGTWWLTPEAVATYRVSRTGPAPAAPRQAGPPPVERQRPSSSVDWRAW
jgi:excisionase family DNA binding protein